MVSNSFFVILPLGMMDYIDLGKAALRMSPWLIKQRQGIMLG